MPRTPRQAIAACASQSKNGPAFQTGYCLRMCRTAYGVQSDGSPDAVEAWARAEHKHFKTPFDQIPKGALLWWTGGSGGHGHVAICDGRGWIWSTDIARNGYFDRVPAERVAQVWGLKYAGWSEDINGVRVIKAHRTRGAGVDEALTKLRVAKGKARIKSPRWRRMSRAIRNLVAIPFRWIRRK